MTKDTASRNWLVPVVALFLAAFAICTAEFIVAGLLPNIAGDLGVDIPTAGGLIAGYALGVAVAGPVLALVTGGLSRRGLLLGVVIVFIVGNVLCALSSTYWMLLGARLLVACCHGLFFGVAMVMASRLAPPGRQTSAISLVIAGITLANVLGVPIGAAIGNAYGWRSSFWLLAAVGALAFTVLFMLIPPALEPVRGKDDLRAELRAAMRPAVLMCYGVIALFMIGVFTLFSYLVPLLTTVSGVPPHYVAWVLFGIGFVGFFGNLVGGRLGDWNSNATMLGTLAVIIVLSLVLSQVTATLWPMLATLLVWWFVCFAFPAPMQARILREAADAPNFASTLISTAFNIGIAIAAAVGGAALAAGWGYSALPLLGAAFVTLALLGALLLAAFDRRQRLAVAA